MTTDSNGDSESSFKERVDEIRDERQDPQEGSDTFGEGGVMEPAKAIGILLGGLFVVGIMIGFLTSGEPGLALITLAIAVGVTAAIAGDGEFMEEVKKAQQQQQQEKSAKSEPKKICSSCGWQNPQTNSYCHDCGTELG